VIINDFEQGKQLVCRSGRMVVIFGISWTQCEINLQTITGMHNKTLKYLLSRPVSKSGFWASSFALSGFKARDL
jgi:hypothetical protein